MGRFVAMLLCAVSLAIVALPPTMAKGTQDVLGLLGRLKYAVQPRHCGDLRQAGQKSSSRYTIHHKVAGKYGQPVQCVMDSDDVGWTVIQRRLLIPTQRFLFYKNWTEYASGIAHPHNEYWIGNRAIHALTSGEEPMTLRVELSNITNNVTIDYGRFKVSSEDDHFRISVGDYKGPEGWDTLTPANGRPFQTIDREERQNCAYARRGGWWFTSNCEGPNLNGVNFDGEHLYPGTGIQWFNGFFDGVDWSRYSYNHVRMMIKPAGGLQYRSRR
ncbi:techylectin-5A-like [Haemaphysalis longicornis]